MIFRNWQHTASARWSYGPWATTLTHRYKSHYTDASLDLRTVPHSTGW